MQSTIEGIESKIRDERKKNQSCDLRIDCCCKQGALWLAALGQSKATYERNVRRENRSASCRKIREEKMRERVELALVVDKPEGCRGT